jgi:Flp pilus assembly protein TadG
VAVRHRRSERGSAVAELAIVVPIFLLLVLGAFSADMALNQRETLVQSVGDGGRYGSVLDRNQSFVAGVTWATAVRDTVVQHSNGALTNAQVCVALVMGPGSSPIGVAGATSTSVNTPAGQTSCYADNSSDQSMRVQVTATKPSGISALTFNQQFSITARTVTRYALT